MKIIVAISGPQGCGKSLTGRVYYEHYYKQGLRVAFFDDIPVRLMPEIIESTSNNYVIFTTLDDISHLELPVHVKITIDPNPKPIPSPAEVR